MDRGTAAALALRDETCAGRRRLAAPDLLLYEIGNALRYNTRLGAEDVKLALSSLVDLGIEFRPAGTRLLSRAVDLAFRFGMTVYDGCFVALAEDLGAPLITADEKLAKKAAGHARIVCLSEALP